MSGKAGFGEILGTTMGVVRESGREVLLFVVVVGGMSAIGISLGLTESSSEIFRSGFGVGGETAADAGWMGLLFDLAVGVVSFVALYLLTVRMLAARGRLRGDENRFWHYFGMVVVSGLAWIIGIILLIVPGIILLVRWSAASGYLLGAKEGIIDSLRASWHATSGSSWAIFFAAIVLFIGIILGGIVIGVLTVTSPLVNSVFSSLIEAASNAFTVAFGVAIYCLVHDEAEEIGEVFSRLLIVEGKLSIVHRRLIFPM